MKARQRLGIGNRTIDSYLDLYYKKPKSFEDFLYIGQLLQAEGIKVAIEAHRRAMPFCMGTLFWQLNECWPVASWSSMDYYGRWKELQYSIKKSFEPLILSAVSERDSIKIFVVSDLHKIESCILNTSLIDFNGKTIKTTKKKFTIPANTSILLMILPEQEWLKGIDKDAVVLSFSLVRGEKTITQNILYFSEQKSLSLSKPNITIKRIDQNHIELSTNTLAKNVWLNLPGDIKAFSDNYFDLMPGYKKVVTLKGKDAVTMDEKLIEIKSLIDTY